MKADRQEKREPRPAWQVGHAVPAGVASFQAPQEGQPPRSVREQAPPGRNRAPKEAPEDGKAWEAEVWGGPGLLVPVPSQALTHRTLHEGWVRICEPDVNRAKVVSHSEAVAPAPHWKHRDAVWWVRPPPHLLPAPLSEKEVGGEPTDAGAAAWQSRLHRRFPPKAGLSVSRPRTLGEGSP